MNDLEPKQMSDINIPNDGRSAVRFIQHELNDLHAKNRALNDQIGQKDKYILLLEEQKESLLHMHSIEVQRRIHEQNISDSSIRWMILTTAFNFLLLGALGYMANWFGVI